MIAGEPSPDRVPNSSVRALLFVLAVLLLTGILLVLLTVPFDVLLGPSAHAVHSALHGLSAGVFMITATIGLFQGYRLLIGWANAIDQLQLGAAVNATLALLTVISGNASYVGYRAPGGPRDYFLQNLPAAHEVFFEFKEFIGLFPLPLAVAAAYILWVYGPEVPPRPGLRTIVSILLALVFVYFVIAFGLGAAITKLRTL